ncbi:MAG: N-acetyl sugar amidotransferase [Bacteriovoracaceae bacterium]|nr:N-acetyl sugar amidotransferase [Bacteriovoracaceae bacterium]
MGVALLQRCTKCLMPATRPRITFNNEGVCNACTWAEEKKKIDWTARGSLLKEICDKYRSQNGNFDCIVPVSGGKDSSYVAYMMKHELKMNPLCVHIAPPTPMPIGDENLQRFIQSGYDCITIHANPMVSQAIAKKTLVEFGQPLMAWMTNVQVAIFKTAINFKIPLIMFGEEGETEYGGTDKLKSTPYYDFEDSLKIYLSGIDPKKYIDLGFSENELYFWLYPSMDEAKKGNLAITHFSFFENWDPYHHYLVAKEKCGLKERTDASVGTYTNFAQTDTFLYDLHSYLMFLKFGFGRCTADVGIDIRRGALEREQGKHLVKRFDGHYPPEEYIKIYCDYFQMTRNELDAVFDKFANKTYLEKINGAWKLTSEIL